MNALETVIFPVAGLGTRMLPATKVTPKELLPVYDTPLLQFAIDEALAAGARRLVFISHPDKSAIEDYVRPNPRLEAALEQAGKDDLLRAVRASSMPGGVEATFVMQPRALGLGDAVLCAAKYAETGPVGVILPDDLILGKSCLSEMTEAFNPWTMRSLVAAQKVARDRVSSYGIFKCYDSGEERCLPVGGFVEKPSPKDAPSTLAAVGRYIITPEVFDALRQTGRGAGGEIQLTDAIDRAGLIHAFRFSGTRHDCGTKDGMVAATLAVQAARRGRHLSIAAE